MIHPSHAARSRSAGRDPAPGRLGSVAPDAVSVGSTCRADLSRRIADTRCPRESAQLPTLCGRPTASRITAHPCRCQKRKVQLTSSSWSSVSPSASPSGVEKVYGPSGFPPVKEPAAARFLRAESPLYITLRHTALGLIPDGYRCGAVAQQDSPPRVSSRESRAGRDPPETSSGTPASAPARFPPRLRQTTSQRRARRRAREKRTIAAPTRNAT